MDPIMAVLYGIIGAAFATLICYIFWKRGGPKGFFDEIEDRLSELASSGSDAVRSKAEDLKQRLNEAGDNADQVIKEISDWLKSLR